MKNIYITIIVVASSVSSLYSQLRFDIVGGVSAGATPVSAGVIINRHLPHEEFIFNLAKVDPQLHAGIKSQVELTAPFFLEGGLLYTRSSSTYDVTYTIIDTEHPIPNHLMKETEHLVMLPVNIGVNIGAFDVTSGLRLVQSLSKNTDLHQLTGFSAGGNKIKTGWQASVGYSFLRERVGLEYQGNFSRVGSGMFVNGQSLEITNVPGQFVLFLQHSF